MLAKKPKSAGGRNGGLASQRLRLQQAKEAAAMLDGPGATDAGASAGKVLAAEAAPRARFKHNVNAGAGLALAAPSPGIRFACGGGILKHGGGGGDGGGGDEEKIIETGEKEDDEEGVGGR